MAASMMLARCEIESAAEVVFEPFDVDELAGDWFPSAADPHYADLPYYVPLDDEDDASGPFSDDAVL